MFCNDYPCVFRGDRTGLCTNLKYDTEPYPEGQCPFRKTSKQIDYAALYDMSFRTREKEDTDDLDKFVLYCHEEGLLQREIATELRITPNMVQGSIRRLRAAGVYRKVPYRPKKKKV